MWVAAPSSGSGWAPLAAFAQGFKKSGLFTWTLSWTQQMFTANIHGKMFTANASWVQEPIVNTLRKAEDLMPRDIRSSALDGIWPVGHACAVLCWGTRPNTILSWLRWPNVSWHQVFHLREPIVNLIIMHLSLSRIHREPIVNLSWTYPRCQPFEVCLKN